MNWSNVRLILAREIRDQLRDRRTMFMVAVLPLLLYPLLGMGFLQINQFRSGQETNVLVLGADELDSLGDFPPLIEDGSFAPDLFDNPTESKLLKLTIIRRDGNAPDYENETKDNPGDKRAAKQGGANEASPEKDISAEATSSEDLSPEEIEEQLRRGVYQAVVEFPPGFGERLIEFRQQLASQIKSSPRNKDLRLNRATWESLSSLVRYDYVSTNEKSQITYLRLRRALNNWKNQIVEQNLRYSHVPQVAANPFDLAESDVAQGDGKKTALWAKVLPFIVLIWALVGAFYPAVDLCAGEKERGTLETLLSSPAERTEIVWGKLFTVMLFSVANAVLNLIAMSTTGLFVVKQLAATFPKEVASTLETPPLSSFGWLLLGVIPIAALFSALSLALASLARSSKEGQYYLMPLVLVVTPLMFLPLTVGFEMNLGNSLIPVTGVMLLLRSLLEGNYTQAAIHAPIVIAVTFGCCWMAVRWAVDQFNKESVLFRESERLDLGLWMRHLVRDRRPTPSVAMAIACVVLILIIRFFMNFALATMRQDTFGDFALLVFISQVVVIAMPAMLMTIMLTNKPSKTLLFNRWPKVWTIPATLLLVLAWHPVNLFLGTQIGKLYPISPELFEQSQKMESMLGMAPYALLPFVLLALLPAICEELTFRGFVLSGLRHLGHKWWSIVLTSVFFGIVHGVLQQSLLATLTGCILGYLAVQTGSLLPCILFHMTHNGLALYMSQTLGKEQEKIADVLQSYPHLSWFVKETIENGQVAYTYNWPLVLGSVVVSAVLLRCFSKLAYEKTEEESLEDALAHQAAPPANSFPRDEN